LCSYQLVDNPQQSKCLFLGPRDRKENSVCSFCLLCLSYIICLSIPSEGLWKNLVGPKGKIEKIKFLPLSEPVCWSHQRSLGHSRREKKGNQDPSIAWVPHKEGPHHRKEQVPGPSGFPKRVKIRREKDRIHGG
jgi:hypothetical protein